MKTKVLNVSFPFDIMEMASKNNGILFSAITNDKILLEKYNGIDNLVSNIYKLMALNLIDIEKKYDPAEGDDYEINLNQMGALMLVRLHKKKNFD